MRNKEEIEKAYVLAAKYAKDLEDENPLESAGPWILWKGLGWVLEKEESEDLFEDMEEEFEDLTNE